MNSGLSLLYYIWEFFRAFYEQIQEDDLRWGDEWKRRPIHKNREWPHQNQRVFERIEEYYMDWVEKDIPIPWLKVCGNAFIAWVREKYPDTYSD